jgi:hypothetical protein
MRNPTGKKLEKLIFGIFDDASQGVDRYNHNDSLWLIFTNEMKWVVEFTKDQTLWYNYNFFKDEMELIGLDCVEDKDLIKKWFESRFLGIPKVEDAFDPFFDQDQYVEDTIQNGVKHTNWHVLYFFDSVEDTIQNGVKDIRRTRLINLSANQMVEDTIQNGVKLTKSTIMSQDSKIEDTIQKGVKQTELSKRDFFPKDIIQNGVKETISTLRRTAKWGVDDIIQNGIKDTKSMCGKRGGRVGNTIQNGVKNLGAVDYDNLKHVEGIIENGVKETYDDCSNNIARVEGIIRIGEKIS